MAGLSQTLREDFLTCKVCLNIFDTPKILPCLHTYCRRCIQQLIQREASEVFLCPECRRSTHAVNRDPDQFQTNFYISGLIEAFTIDRCSVCKLRGQEKLASHQCLDCGDSLCHSCADGHLASRSTVNHRVVTSEDVASGKYDQEIRNKKQVYCGEHRDKECSFYCKSCQKAICVACALLVHKDHQLSSLEDGSQEAQGAASGILHKSQEVLKTLASLWSNVQKNLKEAQERQLSTLSEIEVATEQIIQLINAQKEQTLQALQNAYDTEIRQHTVLKQEIDSVGKAGRKLVDSVQVIVNGGSGSQMLLLNETLQHGLGQLVASYQELSQKVVPKTNFSFAINPALYQVLQSPVFSICEGHQPPVLQSVGLAADHAAPSTSSKRSPVNTSPLELTEQQAKTKNNLSMSVDDISQLGREPTENLQGSHTTKLKQSLQNLRILDPPTLQPHTQPAQESPQALSLCSDPATRSYSEVLKLSSSVSLVTATPSNKASKVQLSVVSKLLPSVKKDVAEPEIMGLSFFGHDRLLLTDSANGKLKSFLKDCTTGFVKEFRDGEFTPSSVAAIKDVIAFTLKDKVYIVTKQYVRIASLQLTAASATENNYMFPICVFDEESFVISNIVGNKQLVLKVSGEIVKELQCPAKSPVFAVSRDQNRNFYLSSWGQPGSVVVTDWMQKRLMVLQPLSDGKPTMEWYPGYSACDRVGNIFVADAHNDRIVVFNKHGKHLMNHSTKGDELAHPMCLIIDQKETMYVTGKNTHIFVYKIKRKTNSAEKVK